MFDNKGWEQVLRKAKEGGELAGCRLPSESGIKIHGDRDLVTITMTEAGVCANMQTDAAAFEAWALALLFHCGVQRVEIALDGGPTAPVDKKGHFQRFLYRLAHLAALFPGRVAADAVLLGRSRVVGRLHLNQPQDARPLSNPAGHSEAALELALEASPAFRGALGFDKIMRQWPVGLFSGIPDRDNRIFTGGKSAIDLIGVRGKELVLVELKKEGNRKAGALSELFFYSCLMRDALLDNFRFDDRPLRSKYAVSREDIKGCTRIAGILLAPPKMHPLIEEPTIISRLNAAMERCWSEFPITFQKLHLGLPKKPGEDFTFG